MRPSPLDARAKPKGACQIDHHPHVLLTPALNDLRRAETGAAIIAIMDRVPECLHAAIVQAIASNWSFKRETVQDVLRIIGKARLRKELGNMLARNVLKRFA